jgi:hypothetical protein
MPSCCGQGATCSCKIETTGQLHVTGSGQPNDPFILSMDGELIGGHNQSFDVIVTGDGSSATPWVVETRYAATAKLDDIPDVNASTPGNAQVLAWNTATSKWQPAAPTVAPTGAVQHDLTLQGDGSAGTPLGAVADTNRLLGTFPTGLGLTDAGMSSVVIHFTDASMRSAAMSSPRVNTLTMLDTAPGRIDYWDGAAWQPATYTTKWRAGAAILQLSGPYSDGLPITVVTHPVTATTDANGNFTAVPAADLTGLSGVLSAYFTPSGLIGMGVVLNPAIDHLNGTAYRLSDGTPLASQPISGWYQACCY